MENTINLDGFIQIAIVVEDIEKVSKAWAKLFGVPEPEIQDASTEGDSNVTYRGQVASYGLKIAVIRVGSFVVELLEPDKRDSTFREFLDKNGPGVHYLGFEVGQRRDGIISELEEMGFSMRQIGFYPGSSWTVVDSADALGVGLNIKPKA